MGDLLAQARHLIKFALPRKSSVFGISFPDREITKSVYLTRVDDEIYIVTKSQSAVISSSGVVRVGLNYLDIDYGPFSVFYPTKPKQRSTASYNQIVLLWSHYWSTYYHWLIDVAPKIAAAKSYFGSEVGKVTFVYPLPLASYEIDTIKMLGIRLDQVVNPHDIGEVKGNQIFALPLPGWCAVSPRIHQFRQALVLSCRPTRRIYISRTGRRRIVNERALFSMLETHGFEFVPDVSRSLADQIELFGSATHIVSPHGAALSNILWSQAHSTILELASSSYSPDYFINLASVLGLRLNRLCFGAKQSQWTNSAEDFSVDVALVDRFLREKWGL
jgi:capsular polysaccharide biosynthesis protein